VRTRRGLLVLGLPILACVGLFLAARSLRHPESSAVPLKRVVRFVDGVEIVESVPVPALRKTSPSAPAARGRFVKVPVLDIATAAEHARIQSTYQNYRTATITKNDDLRKTLLAVLRRDGATAMEFAREDAELAETDSDRAFALRILADLSR
jgi:hypothetical protein